MRLARESEPLTAGFAPIVTSDPLVGALSPWAEITDQGFARGTYEDGSRTSLGAVTDSAWG